MFLYMSPSVWRYLDSARFRNPPPSKECSPLVSLSLLPSCPGSISKRQSSGSRIDNSEELRAGWFQALDSSGERGRTPWPFEISERCIHFNACSALASVKTGMFGPAFLQGLSRVGAEILIPNNLVATVLRSAVFPVHPFV